MKDMFKRFTSILCVAAILVSATSVAAFACLFCDGTPEEEPEVEDIVPHPSYGDPTKPEISDTDAF